MKSNPHEHLFLAGGQPPSIADLLAYEGLIQLTVSGLLEKELMAQKLSYHCWFGCHGCNNYHSTTKYTKHWSHWGNVTVDDQDLPMSKL